MTFKTKRNKNNLLNSLKLINLNSTLDTSSNKLSKILQNTYDTIFVQSNGKTLKPDKHF